MSWQAYVDSQLLASGHIAQAAIVSAADGAVWAASPDFTVSAPELAGKARIAGVSRALNGRGCVVCVLGVVFVRRIFGMSAAARLHR
jgi:hypothetical protein